MKTIKGSVSGDFSRDLFWTKIIFLSDDEKKKSKVFACASQEYLEDFYQLRGGEELNKEQTDNWLNSVIKKWSILGDKIFNQDVHYDVYYDNRDGEATGLNFLLKKAGN